MIVKYTKQPLFLLIIACFLGLSLLIVHWVSTTNALTPIEGIRHGMRQKTAVSLTSPTGDAPVNCRYGVAPLRDSHYDFLDDLGVGWVLHFNVRFQTPQKNNNIEYMPMVRLRQPRDPETGQHIPNTYEIKSQPLTDEPDGLGPIVVANPGHVWIIGNEVDRVFVQDDMEPHVYAQAYHDIYYFIKERDPSAKIATAGLVEVTPGRLQYLDMMWDSYLDKYNTPMPVDIWTMHLYALPEVTQEGKEVFAHIAINTDPALAITTSDGTPTNCDNDTDNIYCIAEHDDIDIFSQQIIQMRQWMKAHGQQNKPLIISEYSLLYSYDQLGDNDPDTCDVKDEYGNCFTPERVSQFMIDSFAFMESAADPNLGLPLDNNRLVQQWLWFATTGSRKNAPYDLLTEDLTDLTSIGRTYQNEVASRLLTRNLVAYQTINSLPNTITTTTTTSATIGVSIYNNGNATVPEPYDVSFYSNAALTQLIGTVTVPAGLNGCAHHIDNASLIWKGLEQGYHPYWAQVDSGSAIGESSESDNVIQGYVIVNGHQIYVPLLFNN